MAESADGTLIEAQVLFWPTSVTFSEQSPILSDKILSENRWSQINGYVIGWEDLNEIPSCSSDNDDTNCNGTGPRSSFLRTSICAGIIPTEVLNDADSKLDRSNGEQSSPLLNSKGEIERALKRLQQKFPCHCNSPCYTTTKREEKGITRDGLTSRLASINSEPSYQCHACTCIQSLKIIAKWDCGIQKENIVGPTNHDDKRNTAVDRILIPTPSGPWWKDDCENSDFSNEETSGKSMAYDQLILFKPCGYTSKSPRQSLDHYSHDQLAQYLQQKDSNLASKYGSNSRFSQKMMRISEVCNIMHDIHCILAKEKDRPTSTFTTPCSPASTKKDIKEQRENIEGCLEKKDESLPSSDTNSSMLKRGFQNILSYSLFVTHLRMTRQQASVTLDKDMNQNGSSIRAVSTRIWNFMMTYFPVISIASHLCFGQSTISKDPRRTLQADISDVMKNNNKNENEQFDEKPERFTPRQIRTWMYLEHDAAVVQKFLDVTMGISFGVLLIQNNAFFTSLLLKLWSLVHVSLLRNNIGWLETFPIGFKLNVPLTRIMGMEVLLYVDLVETLLCDLFCVPALFKKHPITIHESPSTYLTALGFGFIVLGFSTTSAISFDLVRICTFHMQLISRGLQNIFQLELSCFSAMWHLFRGKKRNVLRHRSDTFEYDYMQLILGMVLFTTCLFLFTTILVYYSFFTVVNLVVLCFQVCLWEIYFILPRLPLAELFYTISSPNRFVSRVYFMPTNMNRTSINGFGETVDNVTKYSTSSKSITQLYTSHSNQSSIVSGKIMAHIAFFAGRIPTFISEILSGSQSTVISTCFEMTKEI